MEQQQNEIKFEELSPELQSFIDRERSKASQTAYANAEKRLKSDKTFVSSIREQIEEEARLTGEQKLAKERESFQAELNGFLMEKNKFSAQSQLLKAGLGEDQVEKFTSFLVDTDLEVTNQRVNDFLDTYKATLEGQIAQTKKELLKQTPTPQSGTSVGKEDHYKAEFAKAKEANDSMGMARIIREASAHNIILN